VPQQKRADVDDKGEKENIQFLKGQDIEFRLSKMLNLIEYFLIVSLQIDKFKCVIPFCHDYIIVGYLMTWSSYSSEQKWGTLDTV